MCMYIYVRAKKGVRVAVVMARINTTIHVEVHVYLYQVIIVVDQSVV